ncbi:hypothetical protein ACFYP4_08235 [Streptomyces sp. NPDC005551]|uniref:hypothetical protein n=1 Tax=unclassified Streptomyces TaxID=2593676 RepID=UPI00340E8969
MSSPDRQAGTDLAAVHELPGTLPGSPLVFEVGPLPGTNAEALAVRAAERRRAYDVTLDAEADTECPCRRVLRLTPRTRATAGGSLNDDLLADLLAPPAADTLTLSGHQQTLPWAAVEDQDAPGGHGEQLTWD